MKTAIPYHGKHYTLVHAPQTLALLLVITMALYRGPGAQEAG